MRSRVIGTAIVFGLALVAGGENASASPDYPALIQDEWKLSYTPACTICHATSSGGTGTVVTYFGRQMEAFGLTAHNDSSLVEALAMDKSQKVDSDGSGISDYDDIVAGNNPNAGPGPKTAGPVRPLHGCAAAGTGGEGPIAMALVAAAIVAGARRRKRRD